MVAKFVGQSKCHAGVLKHVIERKVFDAVVGSVNMGVGVLESSLDNESRRVSSLGGRGVIGAGVAALSFNPRNVAVLFFYV